MVRTNVERKGDSDWVKHFMTCELEGVREDAENDLVGLCQA